MERTWIIVLLALTMATGCKDDKSGDSEKSEASQEAVAAKAEAEDMLEKMYLSAAHYYEAPRVASGTGARLPCQFPASTEGWHPAGKACDTDSKRFPAAPDQWSSPTWYSLNFEITAEHYGQYKVESSGVFGDATATFMARVDPDCDGTYTVYTRTISGEANASNAGCTATKDDGEVQEKTE